MARHRALAPGLMIFALMASYGCGSSSQPANTTSNEEPSGNQKKEVAAPPPKPIVVDAGTGIAVTIDQSISSRNSNPGDRFDASLAVPVIVDGKQVIPSGAKATGEVTVAKSAGRFKGSAELALTLRSVVVNGRTYPLQTSTFAQKTKGRGERTAIGAGAGAAAGAIIGAIAGGGKGAAIGAGAGAGAGTGGAALTGNRDIEIKPETKVDFTLSQPLEIRRR